MPTCSSSVAQARQSRREDDMTMRALDTSAIFNVARPAVRQTTREGAATRPEALAVLLARQRAAFMRRRSSVARGAPLKLEEASGRRAGAKGGL